MTQASKWNARNQDYLKGYCPIVLSAFNRLTKFETCRAIQVISLFPTDNPKLLGQIYEKKPDASNILKGVEDILIRLDQRIGFAESLKMYDTRPGLLITLVGPED